MKANGQNARMTSLGKDTIGSPNRARQLWLWMRSAVPVQYRKLMLWGSVAIAGVIWVPVVSWLPFFYAVTVAVLWSYRRRPRLVKAPPEALSAAGARLAAIGVWAILALVPLEILTSIARRAPDQWGMLVAVYLESVACVGLVTLVWSLVHRVLGERHRSARARLWVLVFVVGLCAASIFSIGTHLLYVGGLAPYSLDDILTVQLREEAGSHLLASDAIVEASGTLSARVAAFPTSIRFSLWAPEIHPIIPGWRVVPVRDSNLLLVRLWFVSSRGEFGIEPEQYPRGLEWPTLDPGYVAAHELSRALAARAEYERRYEIPRWQRQLDDPAKYGKVPATIFLYQGIMTFLGANPGYLRPITWSSRMLALLGALARYVYAELLLSILLRSWGKAPSSDETESKGESHD